MGWINFNFYILAFIIRSRVRGIFQRLGAFFIFSEMFVKQYLYDRICTSDMVESLQIYNCAPNNEIQHLIRFGFVFPGQGAQTAGMCLDLYGKSYSATKLIDQAALTVGDELIYMMFDPSRGEELAATQNAQPALVVAGLAHLVNYLELNPGIHDVAPALFIGQSLGELTAMIAAGALSFEDGLKIACTRGEIMAKAPAGIMMAVNLALNPARKLAAEYEVDVSNVNSDSQTVLSGSAEAMAQLQENLKSQKIAAKKLDISIASHSRLMEVAQRDFAQAIAHIPFHDAHTPVVTGVTQQPEKEGSILKQALIEQLTKTIDLPAMLTAAAGFGLGVSKFLEFGPRGKSKYGTLTANIMAYGGSSRSVCIDTYEEAVINPFRDVNTRFYAK